MGDGGGSIDIQRLEMREYEPRKKGVLSNDFDEYDQTDLLSCERKAFWLPAWVSNLTFALSPCPLTASKLCPFLRLRAGVADSRHVGATACGSLWAGEEIDVSNKNFGTCRCARVM